MFLNLLRDENATPGKSAGLNDAMKMIKGEAVLVFDADAKIKPDFLDKMIIQFTLIIFNL